MKRRLLNRNLSRRTFFWAMPAPLLPAQTGSVDVPALDPSKVRIADVRDAELPVARVLPHFARVANSVRANAPDRGFIDISVWRNQKDNRPYNARIMENILSLAWFYCARRPWNPWRGNPALRARLEAALEFWCSIQDPDGRFSEYGVKRWNLAATAFATKFLGEALRLLKSGPPIGRAVHERAVAACRKAITIVLDDDAFWKHGLAYSNQYTNVFAGAPAFFEAHPEPALYRKLVRKIEESSTAFQSPCGYFYEADGPDFGYNLGTHHENVHMAWHYFRNRPEAEIFVKQEELFMDWLAYNAWPETDRVWALNRAIETRQSHAVMDTVDTPVGERSRLSRAFARSRDELARDARELRSELEREWPNVPPLAVGQFWAFSPYLFLHLDQFEWHPSAAEVEQARKMPGARRAAYIHERMDSRHPAVFHFIRTPRYVAAFASGKQIRAQQRLGLGLVWTETGKAVLQSQSSGAATAWGLGGVEPGGIEGARYRIGRTEHNPTPGVRDVPGSGPFEIEFSIPGGGSKRVRFEERSIVVEVNLPGTWTENVPLLATSESDEPCSVNGEGMQVTHAFAGEPVVNGKRVRVVSLRGNGPASYRIAPRV
ncbi:MAG: hypothetical protein JNL98_07380 [Bryobacterales bacterium]|nr:hypothetical protein [Bryobacterales bacterium]